MNSIPTDEDYLLLVKASIQSAIDALTDILRHPPSHRAGDFSSLYKAVHVKPAFDKLIQARDEIWQ